MSTHPWQFQCSVEVRARRGFAWRFWTDVLNWRKLEAGVEFELDGPFAPGTQGRTTMPGQEAHRWFIRVVDPGRSWIQEMPLPGASLMVSMLFEEIAQDRTRITQRLWLQGEGTEALLDAVRLFESTTPDGLKRIAAIIEEAQSETGDSLG